MNVATTRAVLRQSGKLAGRRFESTAAGKATEAAKDTTAKASQTASNFQSKASEGLSKVTSSAGPAISGAAKGLGNALGKIGGRTGRLVAFVERQIPPTIYYTKVGMELSRLVFQGQKMSPPPVATFQSYFQRLVKSVRNPGALFSQAESAAANTNPQSALQRVRNIGTPQLIAGGVVAAECLGFFTIGEMIGRMKLVGYRGDTGAHH